VDVINLGERVETFQGKPPRIVAKCALVFQSDEMNAETKEPHTISAEFTVSMNEKAGLRLLLESWRGRRYKEDEARTGVLLHKLVGVSALISVEHKQSGAGRTYAKIITIAPLPKAMTAPTLNGYKRGEWWEKRQEQYAAEVATHRGASAASRESFEDFPEALDAEDDLPFSGGR